MKKLNLFTTLIIAVLIASCSSDDDSSNPSNENQNGFNYSGAFYATQYAFISDENTIDNTPSDISIILSSVNPFETAQSSGLNYVFFDFEAVNIETGTITTIPDYRILENADLNNLNISGGTTVLDDNDIGFTATSSSVTINSISDTNIDFDFTFIREDGETIQGNYSGTYIDTSN